LDSLQQEIQITPQTQGLYGKAYFTQGNYVKALPLVKAEYERIKSTSNALILFNTQLKANRNEHAFETLEFHVAKYSRDLNSRMILANQYMTVENSPKAIEHYEFIINKNDKNPIVLNNLAWLKYKNNDLVDAMKLIEKALEMAPNNTSIIDTHKSIETAINKN